MTTGEPRDGAGRVGRLADEAGVRSDDAGSTDRTAAAPTFVPPAPGASPRDGDDAVVSVPGFEVLGEIARGGMGVVYKARDLELDREVAVKTLLPELADRADVAGQFDREARIAARLPHPGVPPVHRRGTLADGRPFLAMKLVAGDTLSALLKSRPSTRPGAPPAGSPEPPPGRAGEPPAGSPEPPPARHDLPRFVQVFEQVCQAVGFAHSQGVLHRDLKPSNVMVGAHGEVQVMDWGLAKLGSEPPTPPEPGPDPVGAEAERPGGPEVTTAVTAATRRGTVKGTPAYMPPEQARGEWDRVDARADVFALGAVLCEILTGRPPYPGGGAVAVLSRAAAGDLTDGLARLDACGADAELVSLCKSCLAPEPEDRPADGKAVAEAVAAYQAGVERRLRRAEVARAEAEAKTAEQRKRRRVQLALVTAVGLLVAGGVGFAWWRADRAEKLAQEQRERTDRNAVAVEALVGQAEAALRADDSARADPPLAEAEKRTEEGGGPEALPPALAARLARCRSDRDVLRELDTGYDARWAVRGNRYDIPGMMAAYRAAFRKYGIVPGETPVADARRLLDESLIRDRVLMALDQWLVWCTRAGEQPDPTTAGRLRSLLATLDPDPFRDAARACLAGGDVAGVAKLLTGPDADAQPGRFLIAVGDADGAWKDRPRMAKLLETAYLGKPDDWRVPIAIIDVLGSGGEAILRDKMRWYQTSLALRPKNPMNWYNLGILLNETGDLDAAMRCFRESVRLAPTLALGHGGIGYVHDARGDYPAAAAAYRECVRLAPKSTIARRPLARALRATGDAAGELAELREWVRIDPKDATAHLELGLALHRRKDWGSAEAAYRTALARDPKLAAAQLNLGVVLRVRNRPAEALPFLRRAVELLPADARSRYELARVLHALADYPAGLAAVREAVHLNPADPEARTYLADFLRLTGDGPGSDVEARAAARLDPDDHRPFLILADNARVRQDWGEAARCLRVATRLDPESASAHLELGRALERVDDHDGAEAAFRRAVELDPKYAEAHARLGINLRDRNRPAEATESFRAAVNLRPDNARYHYLLGMALRQRKDYKGALAALRDAVRLEPAYGPARSALAYSLLLIADDRAGAALHARAAARLSVSDPVPYYVLAMIALSQRNHAEEARCWRIAARLDPKNADYWLRLSDASLLIEDYYRYNQGLREAAKLLPDRAASLLGRVVRPYPAPRPRPAGP